MALNLANEYKYLSNLVKKGSSGEAAWAKQQMDTYAKDYGNEWGKAVDPKATLQEKRLGDFGTSTPQTYTPPKSTYTPPPTPTYTPPKSTYTPPPTSGSPDVIAEIQRAIEQLSQRPAIQYQKPNFKPQIEGWGENLRESLLAKIDAAKRQGIAGYEGMDTLIKQGTQQALNMNDVERARAIQKIYEATEASGGYRGGESISGQIAANTMAGQVAGQARQTEANQLAELQKAIELVRQQAAQEKIAVESDVSAKELQALMEAERYGADYDLRAGQQLFEQDFANRQFDFSKGLEEQRLALERDKFVASKEWQDFQKIMAIDDANWSRSESNPNVRAQIIANEIAQLKLLNLPREMQLEIQKLEQDLAMGRVSMDEAMQRIRSASANISQQQQKIDLDKSALQQDQSRYTDTQAQQRVNSYKNMIDQLYAMQDPNTGAVTYNYASIRDYIRNLNTTGQISDDEAKKLLGMYGFTY